MRPVISLLGLMFAYLPMSAQTLPLQVIAAAGTQAQGGGITLCYTLSEVAVHQISTQDIKYREGFWQPDLCLTPDTAANTTPAVNLSICVGSTTMLSALGEGIIGWYDAPTGGKYLGGGEQFTTPVLNATTTFYAQDSTCTASKVRRAFLVTVNPLPPADAGPNQRICSGSSVTLTASGGQAYQWDDGSTNASLQITPQTSGFKFVTVTDANGCTAKDSVRVDVNLVPDVNPEGDKTVCNGQMTPLIQHSSNTPGAKFDGTNDTPSIGLAASGTDVDKIVPFTAINAGTNPVIATLTVTPKLTQSGLTCFGKPDTFTITVNPSPKPQIAGNLAFCTGKSTTLTASGGNTYTWNTGASGANLNVNTAGTYTLTATSALDCTATATAQVTELASPSPQLSPNPYAVCKGDSLTLNPGTFNQYLWSTAATTPTLKVPSTVAVYTVTVTAANTCTATATASVTELPLLGVAIAQPDTLTCAAAQVVLDGSGSAGGPFIAYVWSTANGQIVGGANTNKATVSKPGDYKLVVSGPAQTCPATATITVVENKNAPTAVALTAQNAGCQGQNDGRVIIGAVSGGTGPFAFSLNGGTFMSVDTFKNLAPGNYTLTVRGSNGCSSTQTFSIQDGLSISPALGSDRLVCPGTSVTLDAGNFTGYQWSGGQTSAMITVTAPGTYTVTVSDNKGCTGTDVVNVQNYPAMLAQAAAPEPLTCNKAQVVLSNSGSSSGPGVQYQWTTSNGNIVSGANSSSPTVNEGGDYQVLVTNSQTSCTATATVQVTESGEQITGLELQVGNVKCAGEQNGQITVTPASNGASPFDYSIDGAIFQPSSTFAGLKAGQYTITVQGADGCEAMLSATVTAPPAFSVSIPSPPGLLQEGQSFTLKPKVSGGQGTLTYQWQGSQLSCDDCAMPDASPIFLSTYRVTVTDVQGCTATASVNVDVESKKGPDIITPGNGDGKNDELVFPELNTEPARSANDIVIMNRWGQVVYKPKEPYRNDWKGTTDDGRELPEGTYYYILTLRDGKKEVIHGSVLLIR